MASRFDFLIRTADDLAGAIQSFGFLPYFKNTIPGFSIEEHVDPRAWFSDTEEGVWEWKGPVIRTVRCAYGKFFLHKAAFIREDLFLHLANYRRCGDDFSELYENGGVSREDKRLYDLIRENAPILSRDLKYMSGYSFRRGKGFDPVIMRLQNETYILISDFVYQRNRFGEPYGWGIAEYSTPEQFFGEQFSAHLYDSTPEESFDILADHLCSLLDVRKSIIEQVLE